MAARNVQLDRNRCVKQLSFETPANGKSLFCFLQCPRSGSTAAMDPKSFSSRKRLKFRHVSPISPAWVAKLTWQTRLNIALGHSQQANAFFPKCLSKQETFKNHDFFISAEWRGVCLCCLLREILSTAHGCNDFFDKNQSKKNHNLWRCTVDSLKSRNSTQSCSIRS